MWSWSLKDAVNEIAQSITYIINLLLTTSTVPKDWKKAKVSSIYKSGSTTELKNYYATSVLSIVLYPYTSSCMNLMTKQKWHSNINLAFKKKKKKSTELAVIALLDQFRLAVDNGNLVGACFIDLQKAFDTISYNKLISKLKAWMLRHERQKARLV